jgi:hypothetical protein
MSDKSMQTVDLLISHSQILLRSRDYDEKLSQWGKGNVSQGAVLHKDYVIFDPLPEDAFEQTSISKKRMLSKWMKCSALYCCAIFHYG